MSRHLIGLTCLFLGGAIIAAVFYKNSSEHMVREPAATKSYITSDFKKAPLIKRTEKLLGPVDIKLDVSKEGVIPGQSFTLSAKVKAKAQLKDLTIKFTIPEGVEIVSGTPVQFLGELGLNEEKFISIELQQNDGENHRIHAYVAATQNGMKFKNYAQYNTLRQEYLNQAKKDLKLRSEKYSQRKLKVFH